MATVTQWFDPLGARGFSTVNTPEMLQSNGTNFPVNSYAFDGAGASVEAIYFVGYAANYGASNPNITLLVDWFGLTNAGSTLACIFQCAIAKQTPGTAASILTKAFATAQAAAGVNVTTTSAGFPVRSTITITNLDGITAGDTFFIKLFRDPANAGDTYLGDACVFSVEMTYPDV
jgi:hypothetical protein